MIKLQNVGLCLKLQGCFVESFQAHLNIARNAQDRAGMGRAFGNIGNAYSASGFFEQVKVNFSKLYLYFHSPFSIFSQSPFFRIPSSLSSIFNTHTLFLSFSLSLFRFYFSLSLYNFFQSFLTFNF